MRVEALRYRLLLNVYDSPLLLDHNARRLVRKRTLPSPVQLSLAEFVRYSQKARKNVRRPDKYCQASKMLTLKHDVPKR